MNLKDFQDQFQRAILSGDGSVLKAIPDGAHEVKAKLLSVYQDAYVLRLVEVIGSDYTALKAYLGGEAFDKLARAYIAKHPSQSRNARWVADRLATFVAETEPYKSDRVVGDLANIERALANAFDSQDASALGVPDLAAVAPEDWAALTFVPHPSCRRLETQSNAFEIWRAAGKDDVLPERLQFEDPRTLIVWRQDGTSMIRVFGPEEAMMWEEASKGVRFGVLCEMLATYDDPDGAALRAASYLRGWLDTQMLRAPIGTASWPVLL